MQYQVLSGQAVSQKRMREEPKQLCSDRRQLGHETWNDWRREGDHIHNTHTSSSQVSQAKEEEKTQVEQSTKVSRQLV